MANTASAPRAGRSFSAALALVVLFVLVSVPATPAVAAAITVTTTEDELNSDGDCSLREAIEAANTDTAVDACAAGSSADVVGFDTGVTGTITLGMGVLSLTTDITLSGPGASSLTVSGGGASLVLDVGSGATVVIHGLTVAEGTADGVGGISNSGTLTIADSIVRDNTSTGFGNAAGGILNNGTLTIAGSTLNDNHSVGGYGGGVGNYGTMVVNASTFSGNTAHLSGGAIYNYLPGGSITVEDSTFSGNTADFYGGAIENNQGLGVTGTTFSGNSADRGGALDNYYGSATMSNTTFAGNSADTDGGAIYTYAGGLFLTNATISGNSAGGSGGGIWSYPPNSPGYALLKNTIVADSLSGGNCTGIADGGGNLSWPDATCPGMNADPLLDPSGLQDNGGPTETVALEPGSPAIDAAVAANCPATDQRGITRPQGTGCDGGAFEVIQIGVTTTDDELNADGDCSLREAIEAANTDAAVDACPAGGGPDGIQIPAGTYGLGIAGTGEDANATGDLDVLDDVGLTGAGAGATTVDGAGLDRVFDVHSGLSAMSDLTVTGGGDATNLSVCEGAGIWNHATLMLMGVNVSGNSGGDGGGIANYGTMTINDSTITGNDSKKRGGGITNASVGATMTIDNSTISGNTGGGFGSYLDLPCSGLGFFGAAGIYNSDGGALTLSDSTVDGNTAVENGGGIYNHDTAASMTINRSTISGNHADDGGGGFVNGGTLTLTNSTVSGNTDQTDGGGLWNYAGSLTVNNSTLSDNGSAFGTGGIGTSGGTVTLGGTILANSTSGGDCSGTTITSTGYNLIEDTGGCTITGDSTGNVLGLDPKLGPLADNGGPTLTHLLSGASPAMNAGDPSCPPPATDQRGVARPQAHRCDMGSTERIAIIDVTLDGTGTILPSGKVQVSGTVACATPDKWFGALTLKQRSSSTAGTGKAGASCTGSSDPWTAQVTPKAGSPGFVAGGAQLCIDVTTRDPSGPKTDRKKKCRGVVLST